AFSAPSRCYFGQQGPRQERWSRLCLPGRTSWADDVLYTLAGRKVGGQWSRTLDWHDFFLFLSDDASMAMGWETTEHDLRVYIYRADVLLERAQSRARLAEWLARDKSMVAWPDSHS